MKIAVIGGGISGLGAAWVLQPKHDVHVFERGPRLGGHTHTHLIDSESGPVALDSGFIVYNEETYPLLTTLLDLLEIESQPTNMSFSVECARCNLVYSGLGIGGVFSDPRNALRPDFIAFLAAIQRFHSAGRSKQLTRELGLGNGALPASPTKLADLVMANANADSLGRHYVYPLASALWSTGIPDVASFPARTFVDFFRRHRLFQIRNRLEWRSICGGSHMYIEAMRRRLSGRVHVDTSVRAIQRSSEIRLHFGDGSRQGFDRVIVATHADEALRLLLAPTSREQDLLGAWKYAASETWLHSDPRFLAQQPSARASWNYHLADCQSPGPATTMTYNLNRLQRLETNIPFLVTLNPDEPPNSPLAKMTYSHPIFTNESVSTQSEISALNGADRTYYCGAHLGFGFHEDGLRSAVEVAEDLGGRLA